MENPTFLSHMNRKNLQYIFFSSGKITIKYIYKLSDHTTSEKENMEAW